MVRRVVCIAAALSGCASPIELDVQVIDPCNKPVLSTLKLLGYEARGTDLGDRASAFTTAGDKAFADVTIPLVPDFQLVVMGYAADRPTPLPDAAGVSGVYDLAAAEDAVTITVPIAPFNDFYKPTQLDAPTVCTNMSRARHGATATWVPSLGKVVIVGGESLIDGQKLYPRTVETYDPRTGLFEPIYEFKRTEGGERAYHTTTLISGDRLLIAGGESGSGDGQAFSNKSVVILNLSDPSAVKVDAIAMTGFLADERSGHTAVKLANGSVAFIGGRKLVTQSSNPADQTFQNTIEVFDPEEGTGFMYRPTGARALEFARYGHSATLLGTGKDILVVGGYNQDGPVRAMEIVHLEGKNATNSVETKTASTSVGAIYHAAAADDAGRVILTGGFGSIADADPSGLPVNIPKNPSATVEIWEYNDATKALTKVCTDAMSTPRGRHSVAVVGDLVTIVGGHGTDGATLDSGEFAPYRASGSCFATRPTVKTMADQRARHTAVTLGTGEILIVGGYRWAPTEAIYTTIDGAELFSPRRKP